MDCQYMVYVHRPKSKLALHIDPVTPVVENTPPFNRLIQKRRTDDVFPDLRWERREGAQWDIGRLGGTWTDIVHFRRPFAAVKWARSHSLPR